MSLQTLHNLEQIDFQLEPYPVDPFTNPQFLQQDASNSSSDQDIFLVSECQLSSENESNPKQIEIEKEENDDEYPPLTFQTVNQASLNYQNQSEVNPNCQENHSIFNSDIHDNTNNIPLDTQIYLRDPSKNTNIYLNDTENSNKNRTNHKLQIDKLRLKIRNYQQKIFKCQQQIQKLEFEQQNQNMEISLNLESLKFQYNTNNNINNNSIKQYQQQDSIPQNNYIQIQQQQSEERNNNACLALQQKSYSPEKEKSNIHSVLLQQQEEQQQQIEGQRHKESIQQDLKNIFPALQLTRENSANTSHSFVNMSYNNELSNMTSCSNIHSESKAISKKQQRRKKAFRCSFENCGFNHLKKAVVSRHQRECHNYLGVNGDYQCHICSQIFHLEEALFRHQKLSHNFD